MSKYLKFGVMILTSTIVMYGLMYLNTYRMEHIFFSETRAYMALYMGMAMAVVMLLFMLNMYKDKTTNILIFTGNILIFVIAVWLVRSQKTVDDVSWMKAMIPHHSIAILTSSRANITDERVSELADNIIQAQKKEIDEMKALFKDIESKQ